jgi:hypothetical protein
LPTYGTASEEAIEVAFEAPVVDGIAASLTSD